MSLIACRGYITYIFTIYLDQQAEYLVTVIFIYLNVIIDFGQWY